MAMLNATPAIRLTGVTKIYDNGVRAVDALDLEIREGEFFSLLGPSGCGKTTTLRMIAGFEEPTEGRLFIRDREMTRVPAHKRDIGMVFQNYALFPHRTVAENVGFGLRMRKAPKAEIARRVEAALGLVELAGLGARYPAQLSGGQQQRVALARAIVIEPAVLLCDEPLGALDKKLRQTMQFELKSLQRRIGVTLVYVTHDQEEALTMSDRIAVMNQGRVEQLGPPAALYNRPVTRFVSDFLGDSNLFEGVVRAPGLVETEDGLCLPAPVGAAGGEQAAIAVRPEKVRLWRNGGENGERTLPGVIESAAFQGGSILYRVQVGRQLVLALEPNDGTRPVAAPGTSVSVGWDAGDAVVLER
jgi:putative spermidine/putrescine transport system ATP-binding protein